MNKKLLRSLASLALVVALGGGATYALFTSNTVTISNNTLTTGTAEIKLCDSTPGGADDWLNSIAPNFSLDDLVPGGPAQALTENTVYFGNDSGTLDNNLGAECDVYGDTAGSSDTDLKLVPKVNNVVCGTSTDLDDQFELEFVIGGSSSGFFSLSAWLTNTTQVGPTLSPDQTSTIVMNARLNSSATEQNETCTFDATFTGDQV